MKYLFLILIIIPFKTYSREIGQTEITTDEGIEVFQNKKYYLLKGNVKILSDEFELKADLVKAFFDKDLYDINSIESEGGVILISNKRMTAKGENIDFSSKDENILILGKKSSLVYDKINMFSEELIQVNNLTGRFKLNGEGSKLITDEIKIIGNSITGKYAPINNINEVSELMVIDDALSNIKTKKINMFAVKAIYNKKENIIELFKNVKVIRGNEIITGDYAKIDTLNESYQVTSDNANKVKVLISNTDE